MYPTKNNFTDTKGSGQAPATVWEFAVQLRKRLGPLSVVDSVLYIWDGVKHSSVEDGLIEREALRMVPEHLRKPAFARQIVAVLKMAAAERADLLRGYVYVDAEGFVVLNCANHVLSLSANGPQIRPSHPSHLFAASIAAAYRPDSGSPCLLEEIERELLPDDRDRDLLHLTMGSCLVPDSRDKRALLCHGEIGQGQRMLLDAYAAVLGESLVSRLTVAQLASKKGYYVKELAGKALNVGETRDTVQKSTMHAESLRPIIDGSPLPVQGKPQTMRHSVKLAFCANDLPVFVDGNEADAQCWRMLDFSRKPNRVDVDLAERLALEKDEK